MQDQITDPFYYVGFTKSRTYDGVSIGRGSRTVRVVSCRPDPAVPVSIAILFLRQPKLRLRLDQVLENSSRQNELLHRELLELKRQLAKLQQTRAVLPLSAPMVAKTFQPD
jgi:hypothetical protein